MKTTYQDIVNIENIASTKSIEDITQIISLAQREELSPAKTDTKKVLLLAIDIQNDFMQDIGSLSVDGSRGDVERLTRWMYTNMASLTKVMCSLDCHSIMQIFHANWWINSKKEHPCPFTIITHEQVQKGEWLPVNGELQASLDYLKNLELNGQKQLCIWPYHCLEGTQGAKLESEFTKMLYFHSAARKTSPKLVYKGQNPFTEMYGIIKAEYDVKGEVNQEVLDEIELYDQIYIAGEASSHCVLASIEQIVTYFGKDSEINKRITILEDCMSPIVGFKESTQEAFEQLRKQYGIQIKKSTEVVI
ncbi:cysteine hydrolase family protein [Myroides sp. LJL115]